MLHPIGSLPPGVYWRRRVLVSAAALAALLLLVLTLRALGFGRGGKNAAAANSPRGATGASSSAGASARSTGAVGQSTGAVGQSTGGVAQSTPASSPAASGTATAAPCASAQLEIAAVTSAAAYKLPGPRPVLSLVVTNTGAAPCVQNLADSQIELRVYNGAARVWGSHDCKVEPGTDVETLPAGKAIQRDVTWSGFSSQPLCAGTRTSVGAGTYTLYALLSGNQGSLAQFAIS